LPAEPARPAQAEVRSVIPVGGGIWGDQRYMTPTQARDLTDTSMELHDATMLAGGPMGAEGGAVALASKRIPRNMPPPSRGLINATGMPPEIMFHGSPETFDEFRPNLTPDDHVPGISLTDHPEEAASYGRVQPVEVTVRKAMPYSQLEEYAARKAGRVGADEFAAMDVDPHRLLGWLKQDGYDAIDYRGDPMLGYGLRVFDGSQIRPANIEQPGFTAYHGSPHLFPPTERNPLGEFDPMKIGTGEGSQAYGVGAGYLAGAEPVAHTYKDPETMAGAPGFRVGGKPLLEVLNGTYGAEAGTVPPGKSLALETLHGSDNLLEAETKLKNLAAVDREYRAARDWLDANKESITSGTQGGHMYEVRVNADPARFLDWDRSLSEQHPDVQAALAKIAPDMYHPSSGDYDPAESGQMIYHRLASRSSQADASAALNAAGVPGLRYLDADSRAAGEGTRNAVVFDPKNMDIIRRYGIAGLMAGAGAAATQGRDQTQ
jgi:hypothetical protein